MTPTEELIAAWVAWDHAPGSDWTAAVKEDAIHTAGLPGRWLHAAVAAGRRGGLSVPDAIQTAINDRQVVAA